MTLVWTRSPFYWEVDKKKLEKEKVNYIYLPCLDYEVLLKKNKLPPRFCDSSSVFVFTSYFAAKVILEDHRFKDVLKQSIIFVMGQKTFELFQGEELNVQLRESLSAKGLACQVVKEIKKQSILYLPGAKERAFLIGDFFREQGFESFEIDCYRTLAKVRKENKSKLTNLEKKFLVLNTSSIFVFASSLTVESFLEEFKMFEKQLKEKVRAIVLGERTEKSCLGFFAETRVTAKPSFSLAIQMYKNMTN